MYAVIVTPETEPLLVGLAHKAGYEWCSGDHNAQISNWYKPCYLFLDKKSISYGDKGCVCDRQIKTLDEIIAILTPTFLTWDEIEEDILYEIMDGTHKGGICMKVRDPEQFIMVKGVDPILYRGKWNGVLYKNFSYRKFGGETIISNGDFQ